MHIIEFNNIWKKFKKGEKFNSVRDALPKFMKDLFTVKSSSSELKRREFWALKNVSFKVKKGEVLGIIGPNGAGKSTILKLLSGIMEPNKGDIKIHGRISALIEITAGFHNELTGRENIYLNGTILGMSKKEIAKKFDSIVEFSGLKDFIDTPIKRYSSGMYSRLGFSVAAHMDPDILLVDEVLAVGDIAFQTKCAKKMRELLSSGTTIVLVSHNLALVQNLCKRVILLSGGEIIKEGGPEETISYYQKYIYEKQSKQLLKEEDTGYKVRLQEKASVEITRIKFLNKAKNDNTFQEDEEIKIEVEYLARETIENPVFSLEIIRSDGILCLSSYSNQDGFYLPRIAGQGRLKVNLGRLNLNAGIYSLRVMIWDHTLLNNYHRKTVLLRINGKHSAFNQAIMQTNLRWQYR